MVILPTPSTIHQVIPFFQERERDEVVFDAKAATFFFPLHRLSPNDADQGAGREQESFLVSRKGDALVVRQNFSDFFVSFFVVAELVFTQKLTLGCCYEKLDKPEAIDDWSRWKGGFCSKLWKMAMIFFRVQALDLLQGTGTVLHLQAAHPQGRLEVLPRRLRAPPSVPWMEPAVTLAVERGGGAWRGGEVLQKVMMVITLSLYMHPVGRLKHFLDAGAKL